MLIICTLLIEIVVFAAGNFADISLVHTAKIIELVKPKVVGGSTDSAIMEITSGPWAKVVGSYIFLLFSASFNLGVKYK